MLAETLKEAKRLVVLVAGLTIVAAGGVMLVTPGPGWLAIFAGLALLATEFVWARRLLNRLKREQARITNSIGSSLFGNSNPTAASAPAPSQEIKR